MRMERDKKIDEALYFLLCQKRQQKAPVTGPILCAKAMQLNKIMYGESAKFAACKQWMALAVL